MPILSEDRRVQNINAGYWNKCICQHLILFLANENKSMLLHGISGYGINVI